ncbi:hypothetical protein SAMN05444161_6597 [Rhizobiales bacterium GAS191]|nr:hypothetical protein SAMN05444161_6597 [Rhizobiales bacterium GAS191]
MTRRQGLRLLAGGFSSACLTTDSMAKAIPPKPTLLSAPVSVRGNWAPSLPGAAAQVITRMRDACLTGLKLVSDRQPAKILVDAHNDEGATPPSIWLHPNDQPDTAWIIVDIGERDWSRLAYQFGHEFGHVFCNSWGPEAKSQPPCQWLEEAFVEAFSIRGLAVLARGWAKKAPFAGDEPFSRHLESYRSGTLKRYTDLLGEHADMASWFSSNRTELEKQAGMSGPTGAAVPAMVSEFEKNSAYIVDLGALNRWPARSAAPLQDYLQLWQKSCGELGAPGLLPGRIRRQVGCWMTFTDPDAYLIFHANFQKPPEEACIRTPLDAGTLHSSWHRLKYFRLPRRSRRT